MVIAWSGLTDMAYRSDLDHVILLSSGANGLTLSALQMSPGTSPQLLASSVTIDAASILENSMVYHSVDRVIYVAAMRNGGLALLGFAYSAPSSAYKLYSNSLLPSSIGDIISVVPTTSAGQLGLYTTSSVVVVSEPTPTAAPPSSLPLIIVSSATISAARSSLLFSQYFDAATASFVVVQSDATFSSPDSALLTRTARLAAGGSSTTTSYPLVDLKLLPSALYGQLPLPTVRRCLRLRRITAYR